MHFLIATVEDLAEYLMYFDKNKTSYNTNVMESSSMIMVHIKAKYVYV
jgi:hypothetical protein